MRQTGLVGDAAMLAVAAAIGWWAHGSDRRVEAAAEGNMVYQFDSLTPASSLTIYSPADHTLTVYQGATAGNTHVNCSYRFRISRVGAPIERENCAAGSLLP